MNSQFLSRTPAVGRLLRWTCTSLVVAVLAACASKPGAQAPVVDRSAQSTASSRAAALPGAENAGKPGYHTVRAGETLTRSAIQYGQDRRNIKAWNQLSNPDLIEVGQVLRVVPPTATAAAPAAGRLRGRPRRGRACSSLMDCGTWYGNRPAGPRRGAGGNPRGNKKQRRDGRTDTWQRTMTRPPPRPPRGTRGEAGAPAPRYRDGATDSDGEQRRQEARRARLAGTRPGAQPVEGEGGPARQHLPPASTRTLRGRRPVTRASLAGPASAPSAVCCHACGSACFNSPVPSPQPRYTGCLP